MTDFAEIHRLIATSPGSSLEVCRCYHTRAYHGVSSTYGPRRPCRVKVKVGAADWRRCYCMNFKAPPAEPKNVTPR